MAVEGTGLEERHVDLELVPEFREAFSARVVTLVALVRRLAADVEPVHGAPNAYSLIATSW